MKGGPFGKTSPLPALTALLLAALVYVWLGGVAGAAPKTVSVGNGVSMTVPSGWTVGQGPGGDVTVTHKAPEADIVVKSGTGVTGPLAEESLASFNQYIAGLGLRGTKEFYVHNGPLSGSSLFNEVSSFTFTGKLGSQKLGGLWVFYENSNTGLACTAVSLAKTVDEPKLTKPVVSMFQSLAG